MQVKYIIFLSVFILVFSALAFGVWSYGKYIRENCEKQVVVETQTKIIYADKKEKDIEKETYSTDDIVKREWLCKHYSAN